VSENGEQRREQHGADIPTRDVRRAEPIVSFAQNFEDVMLWRALGSYGPGFYVDVGAGEPAEDSVTQLFYLRGWRGINIEPMAEPFARLRTSRERDINLNVALEDVPGRKTYFSVDAGNGLSTGSDELATRYRADGRDVAERDVDVTTLAEVCRSFVAQEIHFLKLDVEGGEGKVLEGADFGLYRPWIVVSESPDPNEPDKTPGWESLLIDAAYTYTYFDGINRYYVANEKLDRLAPHFATPPNWIDNFVSAQEAEAVARVAELADENRSLNTRLDAEIGAGRRTQSEFEVLAQRSEEWVRLLAEERAVRIAQGAELDSCYQQLYESSRQIGHLTQQRQNLYHDAIDARMHAEMIEGRLTAEHANAVALHAQAEADRARIAEILASRSWRMSAPLRLVADLARGRVRRGRS
jgi:FkbM family methyltransferase